MKDRDENTPRPDGQMPRASAAAALTLNRCGGGHVFFFPHATCPACGAPLAPAESPPDAVLVSRTTVRVGPSGAPFVLGLARVECGAQTLCIVDGDPGGEATAEVVIEKRDGLYRAVPRPRR